MQFIRKKISILIAARLAAQDYFTNSHVDAGQFIELDSRTAAAGTEGKSTAVYCTVLVHTAAERCDRCSYLHVVGPRPPTYTSERDPECKERMQGAEQSQIQYRAWRVMAWREPK